jgi:hypothetical protein
MATLPSLVVSAVTTFDGKALGKGAKQISGFEKGLKSLAKTFGVTFGAAALANYGKNAVKAFAENEKSAIRLARVVKNLGLAFEVPQIERNLDDISAKYGLQGEVLREAFQKLISVTASAAKSTELLNLSLSVSAGSGVDLLTVNQDLAAAFVGQTRGLRKYNLGLTQTQLKTLKFEDAVALLTKTFKGSAEAELDTYGGRMRVLGEAADNAQEIIGGGLVDALMILSGDSSVDELAKSMSELATNTSEALTNLGKFGRGVVDTIGPIATILEKFIRTTQPFVDLIVEGNPAGFMDQPRPRARRFFEGGQDSVAEAKLAKERNAAIAKELANQRRINAERNKAARLEKNKLALNKASAVFDSTRISLAAALSATYDKETKLRLEALMAIEEDKGDLALQKIDELAKFQKNADMQRLAGVEEISNATLQSLNTQLLTELKVINGSKMAENDKELAREEAFKKYNAAITAAGKLNAAEAYNERVQIQLTEIARLASMSKTVSASNTASMLIESFELKMIDRVAEAQKKADDARLKALNDYAAALGRVGSGGGGAGGSLGLEDLRGKSGALGGLAAGVIAGVNPSLSPMPTITEPAPNYGWNPTMGFPGQSVEVTINTGVGDPEAIARAVEDIFNQSSYRGTSVNRNTGVYAV